MMEEEIPIFKNFEDEFQFRIKNSNLTQKEKVVKEASKWGNELEKEKNEAKKEQLIQKRKEIIMKLLK